MTTFRLSAGRPAPAPHAGSGPSASPDPFALPARVRDWAPNHDRPVPLECGCKIPWPIFTLIGSDSGKGRQVNCDVHGWQHVSRATIDKAKRKMKNRQAEGQEELPPF